MCIDISFYCSGCNDTLVIDTVSLNLCLSLTESLSSTRGTLVYTLWKHCLVLWKKLLDVIIHFNFHSVQENRSKLMIPVRQQIFTNPKRPMGEIQTMEELPAARPVVPTLSKTEEFFQVSLK